MRGNGTSCVQRIGERERGFGIVVDDVDRRGIRNAHERGDILAADANTALPDRSLSETDFDRRVGIKVPAPRRSSRLMTSHSGSKSRIGQPRGFRACRPADELIRAGSAGQLVRSVAAEELVVTGIAKQRALLPPAKPIADIAPLSVSANALPRTSSMLARVRVAARRSVPAARSDRRASWSPSIVDCTSSGQRHRRQFARRAVSSPSPPSKMSSPPSRHWSTKPYFKR